MTGPGPTRIGFVCLGNICRSPMADVVMSALVADAGLAHQIEVTSCGTGGWHVGEPMDPRAAATLRAAGYDPTRHRARQFDASWLNRQHLLAMDADNLAEITGAGADWARLFRDYDPAGTGDVPDPYYGGQDGFTRVLAMVERTCANLLDELSFGPPQAK